MFVCVVFSFVFDPASRMTFLLIVLMACVLSMTELIVGALEENNQLQRQVLEKLGINSTKESAESAAETPE